MRERLSGIGVENGRQAVFGITKGLDWYDHGARRRRGCHFPVSLAVAMR